jgi:HEAT repeat protein
MSGLELLQLLGGTLAKGAILVLAACTGVHLLRARSAAGRYAVWGAAFAGLLLLPALTLMLPVLDPPALVTTTVPRRAWSGPIAPAQFGEHQMFATGRSRQHGGRRVIATGRTDGMLGSPAEPGESTAWRPRLRAAAPWLLGVWLLGALAALGLLLRDVRRIARVTGRAATLRRGPLYQLGLQVAAELGIREPVRLALTPELAVPVSWGLLRPVVLLPSAARHWQPERQRVVLQHELAHVRRRDYAGHVLIEVACALHWLNPLVWRAAHRARLEQEQACDDRVLGLGTASVAYAQHLLDIARTFSGPTVPARGALAMAAAATLPERMRSILDLGRDHRPAGRRTLMGVAAAAAVFALPTAAIRPWSDARREAQLTAQLASPSAALRRDAAWSLGVLGSRHARGALTAALRDSDPAARGVAAWALGKLDDRAAVPALVGALADPDPHVREMAVLALGDLGDPRAVAALAPLADDPEHGVRSVTTVALRQIGGEEAAEALAHLVQSDPDAHTRVMAAGSLRQVEGRRRLAVLQEALADREADVRTTAAYALETIRSRESVPALLAALKAETDPDVTEALAHALGATGDPRATDGLVRVLGDTVPQLREVAAKMLGELGDARAVEPLIAATRDSDHEVRLTAVWALDALQQAR